MQLYHINHLIGLAAPVLKAAIAKKMEEVVRDIGSLKQVDTAPSSPLFKAANKIYDLVRKKKNGGLGKERFVESELKTLKSDEVKLEELEGGKKDEDQESDEEKKESVDEGEKKEEKKSKGVKRKHFSELKTVKVKQARLSNVVEEIKNDDSLDEEVFKLMKKEREVGGEEKSEEFKMCCLNLMNTLGLSDRKYNDLRWWIQDAVARGFDLVSMPTSRVLMTKVKKEMVPPNKKSSENGASFDLCDTLFHTGGRLLEMPNIKQELKDGDSLVHLAKIGSDFASGFGKLNQKKESQFDEDGSHQTAFQTLKLSQGDQTLFENKAPGGSELLRLVSKTNHKDTQERCIEEMKALDKICKEMPVQVVNLQGVGKVTIQHRLVNCLHDGKERLCQHLVAEYLKQGVAKKRVLDSGAK